MDKILVDKFVNVFGERLCQDQGGSL